MPRSMASHDFHLEDRTPEYCLCCGKLFTFRVTHDDVSCAFLGLFNIALVELVGMDCAGHEYRYFLMRDFHKSAAYCEKELFSTGRNFYLSF